MMFAKDEKTQRTLRDNWHNIVTDRRYVAVVEGNMEKDYDTVVSWLTDKTLYVSSSEYDDGGSKSITHYKTIKRATDILFWNSIWKPAEKIRFACTCRI